MKTLLNIIQTCAIISALGCTAMLCLKNDAPIKPSPFDEILLLADKLPAGSPLQSNMFTVLGAELGGDSSELNTLLGEYSRLKLEQMQKPTKPELQ